MDLSTSSCFKFKVTCPYLKLNEEIVLYGSSDILGNWEEQRALHFQFIEDNEWLLKIDISCLNSKQSYRLGIFDKTQNVVIEWEAGFVREIEPSTSRDASREETITYRYGTTWKTSGVSIPVFSLRSEESSGIGEFSDLKKLVDWAHITRQTIIQILPINDTTIHYTRADSCPYNAISSYALHPIYLGLYEYPLRNEELNKRYKEQASRLNSLPEVDYDSVIIMKIAYMKDLFAEIGAETMIEQDYQTFFEKNQEWLFPYACFSYFRDYYKSAEFSKWKSHQKYNKKGLQDRASNDHSMNEALNRTYFTQFLLHKQLVASKEYANQKGIMLKGDIPIGISGNSVEAWTDPRLLNANTQSGAPPSGRSATGQNWGFPTYNWEEMAKDGYQWWIKRFCKMADYFDAYRIDHLLGFFRIWEIPTSSVQGLLGHFNPALPLTLEEINEFGLCFDEERMVKPYLHQDLLWEIFGEFTYEVIEEYLQRNGSGRFDLKERFDTQAKIKEQFMNAEDPKSVKIRNGLYSLCCEVLFIKDLKEEHKFHPRVFPQTTYSYKHLSHRDQEALTSLHNDFFYNRHTEFWREEAMKKLPVLVNCTKMLACGEDLGMIPASVPSVMKELKIISLEIQRMPKTRNVSFENLNNLPYLSVCTTSSHDINPIRGWWLENRDLTQRYYQEILWKQGEAPEQCTPEICWQILKNHLNSPSMMVIFPLQDWLSMNRDLRRENPGEERINVPANPNHYWRYRMHLRLEDLLKANDFNREIISLLKTTGRVEEI